MPQPSPAMLIRDRSPSRVAAITMRVPSALYRIALSSTFMRISSNKAGFAFTSRSASAIRVRIIRLPTLGRTRWIATPTISATLKVCEDAEFPPAHPHPAGREASTGYRRGHSVGFTPRLFRFGGSTTRVRSRRIRRSGGARAMGRPREVQFRERRHAPVDSDRQAGRRVHTYEPYSNAFHRFGLTLAVQKKAG